MFQNKKAGSLMNKIYDSRTQNIMRWHAEKGHFRRDWSTLRLPKDVVEWIRNYSNSSPTDYIISLISKDGYRTKPRQEHKNQLELF